MRHCLVLAPLLVAAAVAAGGHGPSALPTAVPSMHPSAAPTALPSTEPSMHPSSAPTALPSTEPSLGPTTAATGTATDAPTTAPVGAPTHRPTTPAAPPPAPRPTQSPTRLQRRYTFVPTTQPTSSPRTPVPTMAAAGSSAYIENILIASMFIAVCCACYGLSRWLNCFEDRSGITRPLVDDMDMMADDDRGGGYEMSSAAFFGDMGMRPGRNVLRAGGAGGGGGVRTPSDDENLLWNENSTLRTPTGSEDQFVDVDFGRLRRGRDEGETAIL